MSHPAINALKKPGNTRLYIGFFVVLAIAVGAYLYMSLRSEFTATKADFAARTLAYEDTIAKMTSEREELEDQLRKEKRRNDDFEEQIQELSGTVSTLDKLRKLDPQLLKKYSKVSFLNENYLPERLTDIDDEYLLNTDNITKIHARIWPFLEDLLEDAQKAKLDLKVASAYRSFNTQAAIKSEYKVIYGTGANQFSAEQGYSEHQLGSAVDFITPEMNGDLNIGFEKTKAFEWLQNNAQRYGFILSYPKGNTYYQYEPWHWRFVGVELAKDLHKAGKNFYDLDQRDIDEYLINIFD